MSEKGTIPAVVILPCPWPPPARIQLFEKEEGGTRVALVADTTGCLVVSLQESAEEKTRAFGPLEIPGASRVILILTWSRDDIALYLNGVKLGDAVASAADLRISPANVGVPASGPLFPGLTLRSSLSMRSISKTRATAMKR